MKIKHILLAILMPFSSLAQDSLVFKNISDQILLHGNCYNDLRTLCKTIGNRVSGSAQAAMAVDWGQKTMQDAGADKVWLQAVDVPHWVRGYERLALKYGNKKFKDVTMLSLGNSVGTDGKIIEARVIMVNSFDELYALPDDSVKGKIVFYNYRFRQDYINTFRGYGEAGQYRGWGPIRAAKKGAVGVIIRSLSTGEDDVPHTGYTHYVDSVKKIPGVAVGNYTADTLAENCRKGVVYAQIESKCKMMPEMVRSYNVIGEIKGSEHPEEIIVVGGHLDSWDVGEGANDDGSGCVQSIEVIRTLKALGIRPKRTVRAVLFMNEENGLRGGMAYGDSVKASHEKHIVAIETDAGSFSPRGIGLDMNTETKLQITKFRNLFLPYGVYDFEHDEGGADISVLATQHIPTAGLLPDPHRYFDLHHTRRDVFETVNHRELKMGAIVLSQFVYLMSEYGLR